MREKIELDGLEWSPHFYKWAERWQKAALRTVPADRPRFEVAATKIIRHYHDDWRGQFIWVDSPMVLGWAAPMARFIIALAGKQGLEENEAAFKVLSDACFGIQGLVLADRYDLPPCYKDMNAFTSWQRDALQMLSAAIEEEVGWDLRRQDEIVQTVLQEPANPSTNLAIVNAVRMAVMTAIHCTRRDADDLICRVIRRWPLQQLIGYGLHELAQGLFNNLNERTDGIALSFYREVLGLKLKAPWDGLEQHWSATMESAFWWWPHEDFVMVCERPTHLHLGSEGMTGNTSLMASWPDGWSVRVVCGVNIPWAQRHIFEASQRITVEEIENENNVEIRRILIAGYGPDRYMKDSGAEVIERFPDDHPISGLRGACLLRKKIRDDEPIVYVELRNRTPEPDGSVKHYVLRVDPNAYGGEAAEHVHAAAASTMRLADGSLLYADWRDYRPMFES